MKYFYLCTAVSLILFFSGCTTRNTVLMDDYHGKKIPGGKLTIVKLFQSPIITNADDVVDDLGTGGSFGSLNHQLNFAIWDNVKGKVVSYGRIADESTIMFGMTKGHWESVIKGLAGKILACSPFKYSFPEYSKFYSSEDDSL
jgi:hypothetical protein